MMDKLIAELEAAPEGSRDLDGPLFRLHVMPGIDWEKNKGLWWPCETTFCKRYEVHPYTTSLDAGRILIPQGWVLANLYEAVDPKDRPWCGATLQHDEPYKVVKALGAKTLELALVIAALKARQEMEAA